jgi:hypothetical protein
VRGDNVLEFLNNPPRPARRNASDTPTDEFISIKNRIMADMEAAQVALDATEGQIGPVLDASEMRAIDVMVAPRK